MATATIKNFKFARLRNRKNSWLFKVECKNSNNLESFLMNWNCIAYIII